MHINMIELEKMVPGISLIIGKNEYDIPKEIVLSTGCIMVKSKVENISVKLSGWIVQAKDFECKVIPTKMTISDVITNKRCHMNLGFMVGTKTVSGKGDFMKEENWDIKHMIVSNVHFDFCEETERIRITIEEKEDV
jgi:hypothetical protein